MTTRFASLSNFLLLVIMFCHSAPTIRGLPVICENTRRRLLQKVEWEGLLKSCSHTNYYTAVYVDKHVNLVAFPESHEEKSWHDDDDDDCPIVAMEHSSAASMITGDENAERSLDDVTSNGSRITKNIHVVKLPAGISRDQLHLLPLGTFPFSKIYHAFEQSEVATTGQPNEGYDLILANCGDFVAQMVTNLDLDWDIKSTEFVAARLHKTYGDLGQKMRENPNIEKWFVDMQLDPKLIKSTSNLKLVELLVESKTIHLYKDPNEGYQQRRRRMLEIHDQSDDDEGNNMETSRRLDVECGQWYSSDCVAESDIRYDRDASNTIADQNQAWSKFDGFYEASATAYGPDGRVLEESFIPIGAQSFLPNQMPFHKLHTPCSSTLR